MLKNSKHLKPKTKSPQKSQGPPKFNPLWVTCDVQDQQDKTNVRLQ